MPRITQISPSVPKIKTKLKVAAYARVSVETEMLMHSLSAQVSYYSSLIQKNPEWEYAGVYADEGITGRVQYTVTSLIDWSQIAKPAKSIWFLLRASADLREIQLIA